MLQQKVNMPAMLDIVLLLSIITQLQTMENLADRLAVDAVVVSGGDPNSCVAEQERQNAIEMILSGIKRNTPITANHCGNGMWYPITNLDMTDPLQQCPTPWEEFNKDDQSVRACGRPLNDLSDCASTSYTVDRQYSKVCGRVIAYQLGSPHGIFPTKGIDYSETYVDGVSITHGKNPRQHIWTYIAGVTENSTLFRRRNCPCSDMILARMPPAFVGNNYFCESANPSGRFDNPGFLYSEDKLWDGEKCEGLCCNNTVPWFTAELPKATSDDIEVRICSDNSPEIEDFPIELLDLYIQ